jgi:hypothetical protein
MSSRLLAGIAFACALTVNAAHDGSRAEYLGGTVSQIPTRKSGDIRLNDGVYFVYLTNHTEVKIPYERINLLEYGQKVNRRYLASMISPVFMLAKKREHFLTIGYQDNEGAQQALMFQVEKNDIRLTLVTLEARTGQRVEFQDEDARIAGKG